MWLTLPSRISAASARRTETSLLRCISRYRQRPDVVLLGAARRHARWRCAMAPEAITPSNNGKISDLEPSDVSTMHHCIFSRCSTFQSFVKLFMSSFLPALVSVAFANSYVNAPSCPACSASASSCSVVTLPPSLILRSGMFRNLRMTRASASPAKHTSQSGTWVVNWLSGMCMRATPDAACVLAAWAALLQEADVNLDHSVRATLV